MAFELRPARLDLPLGAGGAQSVRLGEKRSQVVVEVAIDLPFYILFCFDKSNGWISE